MKAVLQRVKNAEVTVDGAINNLYLHRVILFFYTFVSKEQYFKPQR